MRLEKKTGFLISLILITAITALAALQQNNVKQPQPNLGEDPQPIVDYADKAVKHDAKRQAKGKRYNGGGVQKNGTTDGLVTFNNNWEFTVPAIPAGISDAVIVGTVTDSRAYLSPDTTGVYSEFTVQVAEVLKDHSGTISTSTPLSVDRQGGRVRYPSGEIVRHVIEGQNVPRVNKKYVLFLKLEDQDFRILTGYELGAEGVSPLDWVVEKFKKYKGVNETTFLNQIRNVINSGSDSPEER